MAIELTFIDPIPPNLPSPGRSLLFDVTGVPAAGVTILAEYNTGLYEVVHDGAQFAQVYAAQSVRSDISGGGYRYLVKRAGGWFGDSVTIRTVAASAADEELGVSTYLYQDDFELGLRPGEEVAIGHPERLRAGGHFHRQPVESQAGF